MLLVTCVQVSCTIINEMGRPGWTTAAQLQWLTEKIPQYNIARSRKKISDFFEATTAAFFQSFTLELTGPGGVNGVRFDQENGTNVILALDFKSARNVRHSLYTMKRMTDLE